MPSTADPRPKAGKALVDGVRAGDVAAVARMLTVVERRSPSLPTLMAELHRGEHHAHVVGITGPPGAGKSTLVAKMAAGYSQAGRSVGILAVDPSSSLSGGAILGDRIRMDELAGDDRIYIRSMATRGALGGLARATLDGVTVLSAAGKDVVLVETVGVGQAEIDIVSAAHTTAVVSVPGLGDDVQMMKAGLLEIADVHVLNKNDRPGADRTFAQLREWQHLSPLAADGWDVPVLATVAQTGEGIPALIETLDRHFQWMTRDGELERRERRTAEERIRWAAEDLAHLRLGEVGEEFERAVDAVASRYDDPYGAAARLLGWAGESAFSTRWTTTPGPAARAQGGTNVG
jgi:LAO/AO transport system kinase